MIGYNELTKSGTIICDECGDYEDLSADDFEDVTRQAKGLGWFIIKDEGKRVWQHYCPDCKVWLACDETT